MERYCKNSDQLLYKEPKFCFNYGSRWVAFRRSPAKIINEFSDKYLGSDTVFLKTITGLLRYPENVINGSVHGQRRRYVNPINFYLISLILIGLQFFLLKNISPGLLGYNELEGSGTGKSFLNYLYDYFGLWTTITLPAYVITSCIVFVNLQMYNFSEQVVFYVYAFGITNVLTAIFTPFMFLFDISLMTFSIFSGILSVIQIAWYYKRVFELSLGGIILKTLLVIPIYLMINTIYIRILILTEVGIILLFFPGITAMNLKIRNDGQTL
jgi:hypothetical protein